MRSTAETTTPKRRRGPTRKTDRRRTVSTPTRRPALAPTARRHDAAADDRASEPGLFFGRRSDRTRPKDDPCVAASGSAARDRPAGTGRKLPAAETRNARVRTYAATGRQTTADRAATLQCAGREQPAIRFSTDPETGVASGVPEAAICVQDLDVQCVLQFTLINAAGCALHRRTNPVIHRQECL